MDGLTGTIRTQLEMENRGKDLAAIQWSALKRALDACDIDNSNKGLNLMVYVRKTELNGILNSLREESKRIKKVLKKVKRSLNQQPRIGKGK